MNNITKKDLLRFVDSYGPLHLLDDNTLKKSLSYIGDVCYTYFLHSYSEEHVLNEWEYNSALYNDYYLYGLMDLRPAFEKYHKWYLREQAINKILYGS
jgi:hypothetical protein